ncbi:spore germination protein [Paenibacillus pasadenensis]|uniref:spore germination protein n=1 Tax=Paenibacillus pasadenensis TaxID=217090 RepID=UPI00203D674C|nr:spore germination protein [Paenibacillus pasadenensis]MCM3749292.1 spore germination protein [Paenibacillus pasadenensis]
MTSNTTPEPVEADQTAFPSPKDLEEWFIKSDDVAVIKIVPKEEKYSNAGAAEKNKEQTEVSKEKAATETPAELELILIFCSTMTDSFQLQKVIIPQATSGIPLRPTGGAIGSRPSYMGAWQKLELPKNGSPSNSMAWRDYITRLIFEGNAVLLCMEMQMAWSISSGIVPGRDPSETGTEVSVRGPRDGFVEQLHTNTALIRYRMRCPGLHCEEIVLGTHSATKASLMYESTIANPDLIERIRKRLLSIDAEDVNSTRHLQDLLTGKPWSLFPRSTYTGRPDFAVQCLNNGRAIVLLDGSPTAIVAPINLFLLMKSAEDAQQNYLFVNFSRFLRYLSLLLSCFLPGLYVALCVYHVDQIPYNLLATVINSRQGLPLSIVQEMFLVLLLIEIFREAGARLPGAIGQTLTVVGGLVIGDAAIRAGLISPTMIVIAAMTFVCGSTLVNQSLTGATTLIRFYIFFISAQLGIIGFLLAMISVVVHLTRIDSFGVPYLAPVAPLQFKDLLSSLFIKPFSKRANKPTAMKTREAPK